MDERLNLNLAFFTYSTAILFIQVYSRPWEAAQGWRLGEICAMSSGLRSVSEPNTTADYCEFPVHQQNLSSAAGLVILRGKLEPVPVLLDMSQNWTSIIMAAYIGSVGLLGCPSGIIFNLWRLSLVVTYGSYRARTIQYSIHTRHGSNLIFFSLVSLNL